MMDNGRIMEHGTHEELMKASAEYRAIYNSQNQNRREAQKAKAETESSDNSENSESEAND
jgi:ABC-type multidrug transport system ATPase subunit